MSRSIKLQFILCYSYMYSSFISTKFSKELTALFVIWQHTACPSDVTCLYYALAIGFELKRRSGWRLPKHCFMFYCCPNVCQNDAPPRSRITWAWCAGTRWVKAYVAWNKVPSAILSFVFLRMAFLFLSRLFVFYRYPFQTLALLPDILNPLAPDFFFNISTPCM
jgi:hypothetical protein